jgi:2-succinyl-5-enolpyruvyl-6-hydroxy-3-cyclohexene-1-carboxylate synthase
VRGLLGADAALAQGLATLLDDDVRLDEPAVARLVSRAMPADAVLALASSMPVRDMDMFADPAGAPVPVVCNRGASGIDGTLATACGYAAASGRRVVLVCGDLAFLHDVNSLVLLARQTPPVTVVLVNNDGGGIFSFLPVAEVGEAFEPYFGTPHGLALGAIARGLGVPGVEVRDRQAFAEALAEALRAPVSRILEVRTDRAGNLARHRSLLAGLREGLAGHRPD